MDVLVIGGGVSGLTCAVTLQTRGHRVELWAEQLSPATTSNVAAAFWYPYKAEPPERVLGWAATSHTRFLALAPDADAGVRVRTAIEVLRSPRPRPWWADAVPDFRDASAAQLPAWAHAGWAFTAPVADTRRYLPFLRAWFEREGGVVRTQRVEDLAALPGAAIVNCSGLGARTLCGDATLFPIRGQLVHVQDPGLDAIVIDEDDPRGIAYVVPRGDDCVLGGTAEVGDEELAPREATADAIVARCRGLVAAHDLGAAPRRALAVGLRPGRAAVRLEAERLADGRTIVHDYGHGGAGVTLSWGCADEVATLVERALGRA
ncbi:MAG: FAD-binding oxidoreductase [Nannocystaceae bacterium]|nr:FAD-binding oxidoreductase [Nannocystaceae bacterium]